MPTVWPRLMAAIAAYREYGKQSVQDAKQTEQRYSLLAAMYTGSWRSDPRWPWQGVSADIYRNSRQIVTMTGAIVDLYTQLVWSGDLSTDGKPLPDGTRGAIPIDPQTRHATGGSEATDDQLVRAFHELFAMWQWRGQMSLAPKTAAIFGEVLVELVDEYERGAVYPNVCYPGYVPDCDLDLDYAGNIKAYALEYPVRIEASTAFGQTVKAESYTFRKEVDAEWFRFYKDGKPFAYPDIGDAEQRNPYGFVPACWFRHEHVVGSNRGMGAYEKTVTQALELNSTLSSATDYQRKQFGAPIGVKGSALGARSRTVTMPGGITSASATDADIDEARRASAENLNLLPLSDSGEFVTISFDVGQTMEMVRFTHESLIAENPEATWASKLFGLTQATGPGMQRILAPIIGKVDLARASHDPQMVKLLQMGTSILAIRLRNGDIPSDVRSRKAHRFEAFAPFDAESFERGMLDATIPGRAVFTESRSEKAQWLAIADGLESAWALRELGIPEEDIASAMREKERAREQMAAALSVAGAGNEEEEESSQGPTGPTGVMEGVNG